MGAKALYVRAMARLYWSCIWIAGLSLGVMTLIIPWGVFARYVLGTGSSWPEPLAILLMILFTFSGAAACYRANAHIAVTLFQDAMPRAGRKAMHVLVDLLMAACTLFMVVWGFELSQATWNQQIGEFPWVSVGVSYLPLPVGGIVTLLFIVEHLWAGPALDLQEPVAAEEPATTAAAN